MKYSASSSDLDIGMVLLNIFSEHIYMVEMKVYTYISNSIIIKSKKRQLQTTLFHNIHN